DDLSDSTDVLGCCSGHDYYYGLVECDLFYLIASTPPIRSISSDVMRPWRARLYCMLKRRMRSSAFSVADFIATMRAICSLTAESRKHLKSFTLKLVGTT